MAIKKGVKSKTKITSDFEPIPNYNGREVPPECPAGAWTAIATVVKKPTKQKEGKSTPPRPMFEITWKLTGTDSDDEAVQKFANGKTRIRDWLVFSAPGDPGERMSKVKLRNLVELCGFDAGSVLPLKGIRNWEDLEPLYEALHEYEGTVYTYLQKDDSGDERAQISYRPPAGVKAAGKKKAVDEEDEEEETPAAVEEEEADEEEDEDEEETDEDEDEEEEEDEDEEEERPIVKGKAPPAAVKKSPPKKSAK